MSLRTSNCFHPTRILKETICLYNFQAWKEQIKKAKDLYEEAKAASASQIDRFYLSHFGGGGGVVDQGLNDSSDSGGGLQGCHPLAVTPAAGCHGLLSATASSVGGLAAATVRRSSFHSAYGGELLALIRLFPTVNCRQKFGLCHENRLIKTI